MELLIDDFVFKVSSSPILVADLSDVVETVEECLQALDDGADVILVAESRLASIQPLSELGASPIISDVEAAFGKAVLGDFKSSWRLEEIVAFQTKQILEGVHVLFAKPEFIKTSRRLIDFMSAVHSYKG